MAGGGLADVTQRPGVDPSEGAAGLGVSLVSSRTAVRVFGSWLFSPGIPPRQAYSPREPRVSIPSSAAAQQEELQQKF